MFKLLPAAQNHILKLGQEFEIRRGNGVEYIMKLEKHPTAKGDMNFVLYYTQDSKAVYTRCHISGLEIHSKALRRSHWSLFYGAALWLKKETPPVEAKELTVEEVAKFNNAMDVIASGVPKHSFPVTSGERWSAKTFSGQVLNIIVNSKVNVTAGLPNAEHQLYNVSLRRDDDAGYVHISHLTSISGIDTSTIKEGLHRYAPNGVETVPEEGTGSTVNTDDVGQFIVWCPTSNLPPRVVLTSGKQARAVARSMSERHGSEFFWAKLMGKATRKVKQTYETVVTFL